MADVISVGNDKYLFHVNGGIQGMGGKPYAHKKGKKIRCDDQNGLVQDNSCLCNFRAVKVYRTYCYLQPASDLNSQYQGVNGIVVYKAGMCPKKPFQHSDSSGLISVPGLKWKWCGWYQYIGCQEGYPGGKWTDPQIGGALDAVNAGLATEHLTATCSPGYLGNKKYMHQVQQMHVTTYQCCTNEQTGTNGCCKEVSDSVSDGAKKCICAWLISRQKPSDNWSAFNWKFQKKIGCVGQNKYKDKIQILSCTSARGYSITQCGTCQDQNLYKMWIPTKLPDFQCKYWALYWAHYVQTQSDCDWSDWQYWDWKDTNNPPDQKLVRGVQGWAPLETKLSTTGKTGRQPDKDIYQCKTKRVWQWKTFDSQDMFRAFDPHILQKADKQKCKSCIEHKFQVDHKQKKASQARLEPGKGGAPCVKPALPRSVFWTVNVLCYDLYKYQLSIHDTVPHSQQQKQGCIKILSYKRDQKGNAVKEELASGLTQWELLQYTYNQCRVVDNLGKTIEKQDGSWYFLRAIPCHANPDQWNQDGGAADLPAKLKQVDVCYRAFLAGVYCVQDQDNVITNPDGTTTPGKKPLVTSGNCNKWLKLGKYTKEQIQESATNTTKYKYDLTKTNKWQTPRWRDPQDKFDFVWIKTSQTRDQICDRMPDPPTTVYWRAQKVDVNYDCSDSGNPNWDGKARMRFPKKADCLQGSVQYCAQSFPKVLVPHQDKKLKQPVPYNQQAKRYFVPGCQVYIPIWAQYSMQPFETPSPCAEQYTITTEQLNKLTSSIVFNSCPIQYKRYSLWFCTDPCVCAEQDACQDDKSAMWAPVLKANSQEQISFCSCNDKWATKAWKAQVDKLQAFPQLKEKLKPNQPVCVKIGDWGEQLQPTYVWFYLLVQTIDSMPQQYQQDGKQWNKTQIQIKYFQDPCFFKTKQGTKPPPLPQPVGMYAGLLSKLQPSCFVQSDSKLPNYASVFIGTKSDDSSVTCKKGQFAWCSKQGLPAHNTYYLDQALTQVCPTHMQGDKFIVQPPPQTRQLFYFSQPRVGVKIQGQDISCSSTYINHQIMKYAYIRWGGEDPNAIQMQLQCCPVYRYRFQYVIKADPFPCTNGRATVQLVKDTQHTGYLSSQPLTPDAGSRQWKAVDPNKTIVFGEPTCRQIYDSDWSQPSCTDEPVVFRMSFCLTVPYLDLSQPGQMPWQLLSDRVSPPDTSKFGIKITGWQSYIIGQGPVFQWDVQNAKLYCKSQDLHSQWDSISCNPNGHQFTHYADAVFAYATCNARQQVTHISPRNMQWSPAVEHPALPYAKWTMHRTYTRSKQGSTYVYTYSDQWESISAAQLTCQQVCQWSPAIDSCELSYTLQYTQSLATASAPVQPYGQLCFNKAGNVPVFTNCLVFKCTRKYKVTVCSGGVALAYSDSWTGPVDNYTQELDTWAKADCTTLTYYTTGASIPSPSTVLPSPSWDLLPHYITTSRQYTYTYTTNQGMTSSVTVTREPVCQNTGSASNCTGSSIATRAVTALSSGGVCTSQASVPVTAPFAQYHKTWTFASGGATNCSSAGGWVWDGLVCSQMHTNPTSCVIAGSQTRYAYTRVASAAAASAGGAFSVAGTPAQRYWKAVFTYSGYSNGSRYGSWTVAGPSCTSAAASWNTTACNSSFGQRYTTYQTTCTKPTAIPQTTVWPTDPYKKWTTVVSGTATASGWSYPFANAVWTSSYTCTSGSNTQTCAGYGAVSITRYTPASQQSKPAALTNSQIAALNIGGRSIYTVSFTVSGTSVVQTITSSLDQPVCDYSGHTPTWTTNGCSQYVYSHYVPLLSSSMDAFTWKTASAFRAGQPYTSKVANATRNVVFTGSTPVSGGCYTPTISNVSGSLVCTTCPSQAASMGCANGAVVYSSCKKAVDGASFQQPSVSAFQSYAHIYRTYHTSVYSGGEGIQFGLWEAGSVTCTSSNGWDNLTSCKNSHVYTSSVPYTVASGGKLCAPSPSSYPALPSSMALQKTVYSHIWELDYNATPACDTSKCVSSGGWWKWGGVVASRTTCDAITYGWADAATCADTHTYIHSGAALPFSSYNMPFDNLAYQCPKSGLCMREEVWTYNCSAVPTYSAGSMTVTWQPVLQFTSARCYSNIKANRDLIIDRSAYNIKLEAGDFKKVQRFKDSAGCYTSVIASCVANPAYDSYTNTSWCWICSGTNSLDSGYAYPWLQPASGCCTPGVGSYGGACNGVASMDCTSCCSVQFTVSSGGIYDVSVSYDDTCDVTIGNRTLHSKDCTQVGGDSFTSRMRIAPGTVVRGSAYDTAGTYCRVSISVTPPSPGSSRSVSQYANAQAALDIDDPADVYQSARDLLNLQED